MVCEDFKGETSFAGATGREVVDFVVVVAGASAVPALGSLDTGASGALPMGSITLAPPSAGVSSLLFGVLIPRASLEYVGSSSDPLTTRPMPCAKGPSFLEFSCSPILPGPSIPCDCGLIPGLFDCAPSTSALRPLRFAVGRSAARAETSEETFAARSWRLGPRLGALYGVPLSLLSLVFSEALTGFDVWMQRMCCPVEDLVWRKRCLSAELSREKARCCTILALVVSFLKRWPHGTLIVDLGSP
jgi:hypothetical protein